MLRLAPVLIAMLVVAAAAAGAQVVVVGPTPSGSRGRGAGPPGRPGNGSAPPGDAVAAPVIDRLRPILDREELENFQAAFDRLRRPFLTVRAPLGPSR